VRARILIFLAIFATSTGFDQASKEWARETLPLGTPKPVIPGFWDWELSKNAGAAFSMATPSTDHRTATHVALGLVAAIALIGIGIAASRTRPEQGMRRTAYALIAGGALGNLIDRVAAGDVTDFVRWHWHDHMWPIFNVADAALLIGVAVLLVEGVLDRRKSRLPSPAA
jgi:signal peptidase II